MDRYQALRDLPFLVVIEALGFRPSDYKSRKGGTEFSGKCPCHLPKKNSTSFSYNVDGRFACFACSAKGRGSLDLAMQVRNCGFQDAVAFLEPLSGSKIAYEARHGLPAPQVRTLAETPSQNEAKAFTYEKYRVESPWLKERGLDASTLERFGVFQYHNPARRSAYNGRIMIRIRRFVDGATVGYLIRDQRPPEERGDSPKYVMPQGLHKSLEVYGAYELKEDHALPLRIIYLAESPFTVLKFHELGLPCVATYGWSVSQQQADIIGQLAKGVIALPDRDKRNEFGPSAFLLSQRMWVKCPQMPDGAEDPEHLSLEQIRALT